MTSRPADIALIQRGTCTFAIKALNAQAAGAEAVVIFNQGNTPDREGLIVGTLAPDGVAIPVVGASFANGVALSEPGSTAYVNVPPNETRTSHNVLAESRSGNANNVVMVGAHLDSVDTGPGINDNGSGTAAILETAVQMAKVKPRNQVRFALWGAEELGLVGSDAYVVGLSDEDRAKIAMYLNFDMIGSPNYVRFVYDGDGSDIDYDGDGQVFDLEGPPGSGAIENYFKGFYANRGLASEPTEISFRSDYAAFFDAGIPFGGLFTGAEGVKTAAEAAVYGGTAGVAYDPCYHQACDTFANNSDEVLDLNSDAVAASTLKFAMSTRSVNGVKGKGNFEAPAHDDYGRSRPVDGSLRRPLATSELAEAMASANSLVVRQGGWGHHCGRSATESSTASGVMPRSRSAGWNLPVLTSTACIPASWAPPTSPRTSSPTITMSDAGRPSRWAAAWKKSADGFPVTTGSTPDPKASAWTNGPLSRVSPSSSFQNRAIPSATSGGRGSAVSSRKARFSVAKSHASPRSPTTTAAAPDSASAATREAGRRTPQPSPRGRRAPPASGPARRATPGRQLRASGCAPGQRSRRSGPACRRGRSAGARWCW